MLISLALFLLCLRLAIYLSVRLKPSWKRPLLKLLARVLLPLRRFRSKLVRQPWLAGLLTVLKSPLW